MNVVEVKKNSRWCSADGRCSVYDVRSAAQERRKVSL